MKVLLLPGLEGTGELFRRFVERAPTGFECDVVRYPDEPLWGYREHVRFVLENHLPDAPFLVVGESFSGPVAVLVGAARPAGLAGVVLCNTFVVQPGPAMLQRVPWERVFGVGVPRMTAGLHLVGWKHVDEMLGEIRAANRQISPATKAARMRAVYEVDVRDELSRLEVPVLYLRGTDDRLVPGWCLRQALAARPDMRVERIPGPHLLLQVAPEECWRALAELVGPGDRDQMATRTTDP